MMSERKRMVDGVPGMPPRYTGRPMHKLQGKQKKKPKERNMTFAQILAEQERILRGLK